jgi:murein peptide amidase A
MNFEFHTHRVHNYLRLAKRWKALARRARLRCTVFENVDEFELLCIRSPALQEKNGIYLSAGIHGDEPASAEGLCLWAELSATALHDLPLIIFPCLNPWGLVRNLRLDSQGRDLNRCYHLDEPAQIRAQKALIAPYSFRLGMCLHEDYDAQGVYVYEIRKHHRLFGPELLAAAGFYVPVDLRKTIEGRRASQGWIARRLNFVRFPFRAEAMYLAENHSERNITFETPSEYDLPARIHAQVVAIQKAVELIMLDVARSPSR